jgi:hypothetical protein
MSNILSWAKEARNWIVLVLFILVLLMLWKGCGSKSVDEGKAYKQRLDSLQLQLNISDQKISELTLIAMQYEDTLKERDKAIALYIDRLRYTSGQLVQLSARVKTIVPTVPVSDLSESCDSLADVAIKSNEEKDYINSQYLGYRQYAGELLLTKDKIIKELQDQGKKKSDFIDTTTRKTIPSIKRRLEFYAGADLMGHQEKPFGGYRVNLSMLNRRGQIYEIGAGSIFGNQFYSAGFKMRLSFKKH